MYNRRIWIWNSLLGWIFAVLSCASPAGTHRVATNDHRSADSTLRNKIFPLLDHIEADTALISALKADRTLSTLTKAYRSRMAAALDTCGNGGCYAQALQLTSDEVEQAGETLVAPRDKDRTWVTTLKASGHYALYNPNPDRQFASQVWETVAEGVNRIFSVYLAGNNPHYAAIDSISFAQNDPRFLPLIQQTMDSLLTRHEEETEFFQLPAVAALAVLRINGRDEAARYEPLTGGHNLEAAQAIAKTDWEAYPYNALLVPGYGPEAPGVPLDSRAARRCQMAAERYEEGKALFIIVSGGHAYPHSTPYCEAIEMKKYLIRQFGVPAKAILIEPHARHTTTNVRNAGRLIYRVGMPLDKPTLIVTDRSQTAMITNMEARCMKELGYLPYRDLKNLNENETEFRPVATVFQTNVMDPLDP